MVLTCVHDLQPKRLIQMVTGELIRCYPLSMARVDGKPMPVRHAIISACSGWIRVKLWGQDALDALLVILLRSVMFGVIKKMEACG